MQGRAGAAGADGGAWMGRGWVKAKLRVAQAFPPVK